MYDTATVDSVAMTNAKGRLAEAYTGPSGSKITDLGFSYSARGETTDAYESTAHSGGYYHLNATYWPSGMLNTLNPNVSGLPNWTYAPDGEGRVATVTASSGLAPLRGATYAAAGAVPLQNSFTFGTGAVDTFSYDSHTGRQTNYTFNVNGHVMSSNLVWNANGTLQQLQISDPLFAGSDNSCSNVYL